MKMLVSANYSATSTIYQAAPLPHYISLLSSSPPRPDNADTLAATTSSLPTAKTPNIPMFKPGLRAASIPNGAVTGFQKASQLLRDSGGNANVFTPGKHSTQEQLPKQSRNNTDSDSRIETSLTSRDLTCRSNETPRLQQFKKKRSKARITFSDKRNSSPDQRLLIPAAIVKPSFSSAPTSNGASVTASGDFVDLQHSASTATAKASEVIYSKLEDDNQLASQQVAFEADRSILKPVCEDSPNKRLKLSHGSPKPHLPNPSKPPRTTRAPPKKPLTITGQAIANAQTNESRQLRDLDRNVPSRSTQNISAVASVNSPSHETTKKRSNTVVLKNSSGPTKKISRGKKPKKSTCDANTRHLRSPSSAMSRIANQQFVFGTSSQIERDAEIEYAHQLAMALKLSTSTDSFTAQQAIATPSVTILSNASRNMWSAASRGPDGDVVLNANTSLRQDSAENFHLDTFPNNLGKRSLKSEKHPSQQADLTDRHEELLSGENVSCQAKSVTSRIRLGSGQLSKRKMTLQAMKFPQASKRGASVISEILGSHNVAQTRCVHTNGEVSNPACQSINSKDAEACQRRKKAHDHSGSNQDSQARSRGRPPKALVERSSKQPNALNVEHTSDHLKATAPDIRTIAQQVTTPSLTEEIEDNEKPSPSPPRLISSQHPVQLRMAGVEVPAIVEDGLTEIGSECSATRSLAEAEIFTLIAQMVKSQPSSRDPHSPTWHEKMLLYDPISLEDFTEWLNTNMKSTIDHARLKKGAAKDLPKLKLNLVQKWCQKNGVCCLCKGGLKNGFQQRF